MIAANALGCREIIIDDRTLLLVPIEDSKAVTQAVVKLTASRDLREKIWQGGAGVGRQ